ncbi:hypothetical protein B0T14DRAFT_222711 [Immersiella caudata]|uniref:C2H2-type domain-containing protein n=1 Tax=Immersiella caudata TaxID=314043 RepID=A0AA39WR24_9PEZI|nr:hypothetical protein B0T14DRAFT_222711 [Immersiella caudata]
MLAIQNAMTRCPHSSLGLPPAPAIQWRPRNSYPTCKTHVRYRAELNKHIRRHEKPFKCDVPGCVRSEQGFTAFNNLARHEQSVHGSLGVKYRCTEGQCIIKGKRCPRADNFRQHLKGVHRIDISLEDLHLYEVCAEVVDIPDKVPMGSQGGQSRSSAMLESGDWGWRLASGIL